MNLISQIANLAPAALTAIRECAIMRPALSEEVGEIAGFPEILSIFILPKSDHMILANLVSRAA